MLSKRVVKPQSCGMRASLQVLSGETVRAQLCTLPQHAERNTHPNRSKLFKKKQKQNKTAVPECRRFNIKRISIMLILKLEGLKL